MSRCSATLCVAVNKLPAAATPLTNLKSSPFQSSASSTSTSALPSSSSAPFSPSVRRLWLWGENANGELSSGDELDIRTPLELRNFSAKGDIAQFSLGLHHTVCLTLSNDVYTAGSWISGLLGHDERANVHRLKKLRQFAQLKQLQPTNPIISIGCGDRHSVALHASGELYTWGGTLYGKLGRTGDSNNTYYLVSSLAGKRVTQVAVGNCIVEGTLVALADGTSVPIEKVAVGTDVLSYHAALSPDETEGLVVHQVDNVFDQGRRACVELLFSDGRTLVCTPDHRIRTADGRWVEAGQLKVGTDEVAVGVEYAHATEDDDGKSGWQLSTRANLGYDLNFADKKQHKDARALPLFRVRLVGRRDIGEERVFDLSVNNPQGDDSRSFLANGIVVHNCHTAVCTDEGEVYTFGGGGKHYNKGALGTGDTEDSMLPRRIPTFGNTILVRNICCGGYHTLALTADRHVYAWGRGEFGQLGLGHDNNETEPRLIETLAQVGRVTVLAAGENHSLATCDTGDVYSWGYGQQGQLGHGSSSNEKIPKLINFFTLRNVVVTQVAAGWRHSLALTTELHVYSWGHGDKGQLGVGDTKSSLVPRVVEALLGKEVRQVAAGGSHSLAFNAFFKGAPELYARELERQEKERRRAQGEPMEEDDRGDGRQRVKRANDDGAHTGGRGPANEAKSRGPVNDEWDGGPAGAERNRGPAYEEKSRDDDDNLRSPDRHNKPAHSTLTSPYSTSSALSVDASQLCVELVYSAQVQLTHRFITFQTTALAATFTPLIHTYIEQQYSDDPGMTFDNFIISPGNVLPRALAHPHPTLDPEVGEHVYEYDDGPVRVTVMIVTRTHAENENLWPPWAASMYERIKEPCGGGEKPGVFQPCFREIRPAALREIIQQRQRKSGR